MANEEQLSLDLEITDCLLLSLRPGPYDRIKSGMKKYEYRRKFINRQANAFVYVSSPV